MEPPPAPPLPKIKTMMVGDGTLAGDMNFDPLQLADSPDKLAWFREAEIKHSRLAMLAALGWPVSELTNMGGLLNPDGRAPALLNGGLGMVSTAYWAGAVAFAALCEAKAVEKQFGKKDDYLPGQLGLDLLGMDSDFTRNAEITNGRVAMVAITAFALEEAVLKSPIFPINLFSPFQAAEVAAPVAAVAAAAEKVVLNADGTLDLGLTPKVVEEVVAPILEATAEAVAPIAEAVASIPDAVAPIAEAVAPVVDAVMP